MQIEVGGLYHLFRWDSRAPSQKHNEVLLRYRDDGKFVVLACRYMELKILVTGIMPSNIAERFGDDVLSLATHGIGVIEYENGMLLNEGGFLIELREADLPTFLHWEDLRIAFSRALKGDESRLEDALGTQEEP